MICFSLSTLPPHSPTLLVQTRVQVQYLEQDRCHKHQDGGWQASFSSEKIATPALLDIHKHFYRYWGYFTTSVSLLLDCFPYVSTPPSLIFYLITLTSFFVFLCLSILSFIFLSLCHDYPIFCYLIFSPYLLHPLANFSYLSSLFPPNLFTFFLPYSLHFRLTSHQNSLSFSSSESPSFSLDFSSRLPFPHATFHLFFFISLLVLKVDLQFIIFYTKTHNTLYKTDDKTGSQKAHNPFKWFILNGNGTQKNKWNQRDFRKGTRRPKIELLQPSSRLETVPADIRIS